jgi:uncharacterized membrane protein YdbT with pleckstrin-like domain
MKTKLKTDEKIILITKPHWLTLGIPFLITLTGSIIGIFIGSYGLLAVLILMGYFFYKILERNNNIWAVTNLRVIDEFGVISNNAKESPIDKINNVSYRQSFWGKIFGFGDVQIQTAAEIGSTVYVAVDDPKKLKDTITQMQEEYKQTQIKKQANELASAIVNGQKNSSSDVASEIEKLFDLKQKGILTEEEFNYRKKKILDS